MNVEFLPLNRVWFVSKGRYTSPLHGSSIPMILLSSNFHDDLVKVAHSVNHDWRRKTPLID